MNNSKLVGRKALVTGGGQGIGAGICRKLSSHGASVAIVDLQFNKARQLANQINSKGGIALALSYDISTKQGCWSAVEETANRLGGLDILINCASPSRKKEMIGRLANADWSEHAKTVISSTIELADAAQGFLASNGKGTIVNISSVAGNKIADMQCSWPYHVTKAGLDQLTRWLAVRLGEQGIRVNAVSPGLIDRDTGYKLSDNPDYREIINAVVPLKRSGNANDVANAVIFLCSEESSYITGQVLTIDGGLGLSEIFGASLKTFNIFKNISK